MMISPLLPFPAWCQPFKEGWNPFSAVTQPRKAVELCFCCIFHFLSWEVWDDRTKEQMGQFQHFTSDGVHNFRI